MSSAVAGLTVAVGAVLLVSGGFYVPGTIIAVFALIQLAGMRPSAVLPQPLPSQPGWQPPPQLATNSQQLPTAPPAAAPFGTPWPAAANPHHQPADQGQPASGGLPQWDFYGATPSPPPREGS